jgi:hypothetical protein
VKSKEQALAMADALIAPANTKRRRQFEDRQQLLFGSALSAIPEANRPEVQESARRYAARRWYLYVPSAVVVAWVLIVAFWLPGAGHYGVSIAGAPMTARLRSSSRLREVAGCRRMYNISLQRDRYG